jgi:hypothetical protein
MMKSIVQPLVVVLALTSTGSQAFAQRGRGGGGAARGTARSNVNASRNVNANRNVNAERNVYVNRDVDVHGGYGRGYGCCYHPVAAGAAIATTAVVTAAVVGSIVNTLPPSCSAVVVNQVTYQQCGSTWYQPQFSGTSTTYVVVNPPQ